MIVQNANTIMPGMVDNFPGDDEAKIRGLKYVVMGDCDSTLICVANLGSYDAVNSNSMVNVLSQEELEVKIIVDTNKIIMIKYCVEQTELTAGGNEYEDNFNR